MSQPAITITELDGALGVTPESAGKLLALVGPATAGPKNLPAAFARVKDVISTFTGGPLVEAGCHSIERYSRPVILVRTDASTAGSAGTLVTTGVTGTSVVTLTGLPNDDYELALRVVKGGTIGVAGITFQWSLDGGRTWSPLIALGTATTFPIPGAGGLTLNFAAGTLVAGDAVTSRTSAPTWSAAELGAGLDALAASQLAWEIVEPVGPIDSNSFDTLELKLAAMAAGGKYRAWSGGARMPNAGESEATYFTALSGIFGSKASLHGELAAGACKLTSSVSGRKYKRPASYVIAAREAASSEEVNIADVNLGPLAGVSIRDANGNPDEHDESLYPGLDDARFAVLRTWEGFPGVYVNRPRLFSPAGSDFQLMPHRRVLNLAHGSLRGFFIRRLNRPILVSAATGFILEEEALEIEAGARKSMEAVLLAKPKASAVQFALSRTDNLLSTKTLTGDARVVPLGYPEYINLTVGFYNPALAVQAV
jgi:Protein of unknown function (DUF2586)